MDQYARKTFLKAQGKDALRVILTDDLREYSREIELIKAQFAEKCDFDPVCPHLIRDPKTGEQRRLRGTDTITPCQSRACQIEQVSAWIAKVQRWLTGDKWSGSADASDDKRAEETITIPADGYVDLILRTELTMHDAIRAVAQSVRDLGKSLVTSPRSSAIWNKTVSVAAAFISNYIWIIIAIIIVLTVVILFIVRRKLLVRAS